MEQNETIDKMVTNAGEGCELPKTIIDEIKNNVNNSTFKDAAAPIAGVLSEATGADVTIEDVAPMVEATGVPPEMLAPVTSTSVSKFGTVASVEGKDYTAEDVMSILSDIDQINSSFELHRRSVEAKQHLQMACTQAGIAYKDQLVIDEKIRSSNYNENELVNIMMDEKLLNKTFFTKDNGNVIKTRPIKGSTDFEIKREIISFIYSMYMLEKSMNEEVDEINKETNSIVGDGVDILTDHIANTFMVSIEKNRETIMSEPDSKDKTLALKRLDALKNAFTLDDIKALVNGNRKVVSNAVFDYDHESCLKRIGARYAEQKTKTNTGSALYSSIADDHSQSIEAKFLNPTEYTAGYENLFAFFLLRYYAQKNWKEEGSFIRDQHNAACTLLRALLEGRMVPEVRDEFVSNIREVWKVLRLFTESDSNE